MSYIQFMFDGAGPGDCEEIDFIACRHCERNNEDLDMLRYHLSIIMMHLYDEGKEDLGELELSIVRMCQIMDIDFNYDKTLKVQKI